MSQCQFFLALCDVICGTTKCVAAGLSNMTHSATLSIVRPIPHRGLSRVEAATYIGISASKFDELVRDGRMPSPKRIDGRKMWDVRQLDLAFDALPVEPNLIRRTVSNRSKSKSENESAGKQDGCPQ